MLNILSIYQRQKIVYCHRYFVSLVIKKKEKSVWLSYPLPSWLKKVKWTVYLLDRIQQYYLGLLDQLSTNDSKPLGAVER